MKMFHYNIFAPQRTQQILSQRYKVIFDISTFLFFSFMGVRKQSVFFSYQHLSDFLEKSFFIINVSTFEMCYPKFDSMNILVQKYRHKICLHENGTHKYEFIKIHTEICLRDQYSTKPEIQLYINGPRNRHAEVQTKKITNGIKTWLLYFLTYTGPDICFNKYGLRNTTVYIQTLMNDNMTS